MRLSENELRLLIRGIIQEKKRPKPKVTLWDAIRAKRARGEKPAKPGEPGYPGEETWASATGESEDENEDTLTEKKKKGLWANIHAKKKRGEKSNPRSKEYQAAKKAGQKINRDTKKKKK